MVGGESVECPYQCGEPLARLDRADGEHVVDGACHGPSSRRVTGHRGPEGVGNDADAFRVDVEVLEDLGAHVL